MHAYLEKNHKWGDCVYRKSFDETKKQAPRGAGGPPNKKRATQEANMAEGNSAPHSIVRWGSNAVVPANSTNMVDTAMAQTSLGMPDTAICSQHCCATTHSFVHHFNQNIIAQVETSDTIATMNAKTSDTVSMFYQDLDANDGGTSEVLHMYNASEIVVDKK